jgi:uncharacterized membrane protein YfcA
MEAAQLAILAAAAFATSVLSAVLGLAGGITLLAVMLLFFEPLVAIPLHAAVQLFSNSSRAVVHARELRWPIVASYALPLLPFGFAGLALARELPEAAARALIGVFVLAATWLPGLLFAGARAPAGDPRWRFLGLGCVVGFLNPTLGATGPLAAPFFLNLGLSRFALIGTQAACASLGHLAKIAVFGAVGFSFLEHLPLLVVLAACVVAGTALGTRLLERVDERTFTALYKGALTLIALRLVTSAVL